MMQATPVMQVTPSYGTGYYHCTMMVDSPIEVTQIKVF